MEEEQGVISLGTLSNKQIEWFKKMLAESDCLSGVRLGVKLPCGCVVESRTDREEHEDQFR